MKKVIISSLIIGFLVILCFAVNNKINNLQVDVISSSEPTGSNSSETKVPKASPKTVDYSSVAKFKATSRKKEYRIGDLLPIDFAMLNTSKETILFLELRWTEILIKDSTGNDIPVPGHNYALRMPKLNKLEGGVYDSSYLIYVIGCKGFKGYGNWKSMEDDFENNRFSNWDNNCLPIDKPGKYYIYATIENSYVNGIENDGTGIDQKYKTAIGKMKTVPFEITITE